jgi:hypothetical protein
MADVLWQYCKQKCRKFLTMGALFTGHEIKSMCLLSFQADCKCLYLERSSQSHFRHAHKSGGSFQTKNIYFQSPWINTSPSPPGCKPQQRLHPCLEYSLSRHLFNHFAGSRTVTATRKEAVVELFLKPRSMLREGEEKQSKKLKDLSREEKNVQSREWEKQGKKAANTLTSMDIRKIGCIIFSRIIMRKSESPTTSGTFPFPSPAPSMSHNPPNIHKRTSPP